MQNRKPVFTANELIQMIKSSDEGEIITAARRIWTDWNVLDDQALIKQDNIIEDILVNNLVKSGDKRSSWHFMICLGLLNSKQGLPIILSKVKSSTDENIRGFGIEAISKYENHSSDVKELLAKSIQEDESLVVRVNSIRALYGKYHNSRNLEISKELIKLLNEQSHSAVKSTIMEQIANIGCIGIVPDLVHILITRRTEIDKKMAGTALDKIAEQNGYASRKELINMVDSSVI